MGIWASARGKLGERELTSIHLTLRSLVPDIVVDSGERYEWKRKKEKRYHEHTAPGSEVIQSRLCEVDGGGKLSVMKRRVEREG